MPRENETESDPPTHRLTTSLVTACATYLWAVSVKSQHKTFVSVLQLKINLCKMDALEAGSCVQQQARWMLIDSALTAALPQPLDTTLIGVKYTACWKTCLSGKLLCLINFCVVSLCCSGLFSSCNNLLKLIPCTRLYLSQTRWLSQANIPRWHDCGYLYIKYNDIWFQPNHLGYLDHIHA